jgi:hypothetical protein
MIFKCKRKTNSSSLLLHTTKVSLGIVGFRSVLLAVVHWPVPDRPDPALKFDTQKLEQAAEMIAADSLC